MTELEKVLEALKAGKTVEIGHTWYFTDLFMACSGTDEEYTCCSDFYLSLEEAAEHALMMGDVTDIY